MSASGSSASGSQDTKPSHDQIRDAAKAVGYSLGDEVYAIVGGAACTLLGSPRVTEDVDFVVPKGGTLSSRKLLKRQESLFYVESRTNHTWYKSQPPVEIEILAPPSLFQENFDHTTPFIIINNIKVLKPSLILNAKCNSILGRASEDKKRTDAEDIQFCLWWCHTNNSFPTALEVPRANKQFVEWFVGKYMRRELWTNARYNWQTGSF